MRCEAITTGGGRCKLEATHGSYCWSHAPETAEARRRRGSRGGRAGGNGRVGVSEAAQIRKELKELASGIHAGSVDRRDAAVLVQIANARTRLCEVEMKVREHDELVERIAELEQEITGQSPGGSGGWKWRA